MAGKFETFMERYVSRRGDLRLLLGIAGAVVLIVFFGQYLLTMHPPRDQYGFVVGRDFVNMWMGARMVLEGHAVKLFNNSILMWRLVEALGPMDPHNWSYPPVVMLFIWPLGTMPYMTALYVWTAVGYGLFLAASASHGRSLPYLLFVAASPLIAVNIYSGQNGFFTAAILIFFFRFLDSRPLLAGAILGLMLYKPHLAVLFPIALALSGRWKTFIAAGVSVAALAGVTALVFGPEIWTGYFRQAMPVQYAVMTLGTGFLTMMPTGFMHARMLEAPIWMAWGAQLPFTLLGLAAVIWTFLKKRDAMLSAAVLVTAAIIASPYSFNYDMMVFAWIVAMLWPRLSGAADRTLLVAVWTLPLTVVALGEAGLPFGAPILAIFLIGLIWQLKRGEAVLQPG